MNLSQIKKIGASRGDFNALKVANVSMNKMVSAPHLKINKQLNRYFKHKAMMV